MSNEQKSKIPPEWEFIKNIIDEASLPELGMPKRWEDTQKSDQKTAFNPSTSKALDPKTGEIYKTKIGFIKSSKGQNPMQGSKTPDVVRYERFFDDDFQKSLVKDEMGRLLAPCLSHGDYVQVEELEADHFQAKSGIRDRQIRLVENLNNDKRFANFVMQLPGMNKFFVKAKMEGDKEEKYYGTLFFYKLYFNDIDNIWLICHACNLHKTDEDYIDWLRNKWTYGKKFFDDLANHPEQNGILKRIGNDKVGLAEFAIQWFWNTHGTYISKSKSFLENVRKPFMLLNQKIDYCANEGRLDEAERLLIYLEMKEKIAGKVMQINPEQTIETVEKTQGKKPTEEDIKKAANETVQQSDIVIEENFEQNLTKEVESHAKYQKGNEGGKIPTQNK